MSVDVSVDEREDFMRRTHQAYARPLLRVVLRSTGGDTQWAEDVVQETMIRAWRHVDVLRNGGYPSLLPWLTTVARNIVVNDRRASRERPRANGDALFDVGAAADPADAVVDRAVVHKALSRLARPHRDVIVGIYLRDQALADVARTLRLPLGTVKSRAHYALRALRTCVSGQR